MSDQVRVKIKSGPYRGQVGIVVYESQFSCVVLFNNGDEEAFMKDDVEVVNEP